MKDTSQRASNMNAMLRGDFPRNVERIQTVAARSEGQGTLINNRPLVVQRLWRRDSSRIDTSCFFDWTFPVLSLTFRGF